MHARTQNNILGPRYMKSQRANMEEASLSLQLKYCFKFILDEILEAIFSRPRFSCSCSTYIVPNCQYLKISVVLLINL